MEQQEPRHVPATRGLACDACDMGPCVFEREDSGMVAPCGISPDEMALKNLAEKICEGLGEYKAYARHLTITYDIDTLIAKAADVIPTSVYFTNTASEMFRDYRRERLVAFGLGGLEQDMVNICAVAAPHHVFTLFRASRDPAATAAAYTAGAQGINIVSLGYPGAEVSYALGLPCIGTYVVLDDAYKTGGIDAVYTGGESGDIFDRAAKAFAERSGAPISVPPAVHHLTGMDIDPRVINEAYRSGAIKGAVVFYGATSPSCSWDMDTMAQDLMDAGYLVLVTGARLYEGTSRDYGRPCVVHLGFCEVGKILTLGLCFKPALLVPGWKNAKLLTSCIGMLHEGYPVVMGVPLTVTQSVQDALRERGLVVEEDGAKVVGLVDMLR